MWAIITLLTSSTKTAVSCALVLNITAIAKTSLTLCHPVWEQSVPHGRTKTFILVTSLVVDTVRQQVWICL